MPRRISDYPDAFAGWNLISSFGSIISVVATWVFLKILFDQLVYGKATSRYPWLTPQFYTDTLQALLNRAYNSLEWCLNSPPKPHAFVSLPLQSGPSKKPGLPNIKTGPETDLEKDKQKIGFCMHTNQSLYSAETSEQLDHPCDFIFEGSGEHPAFDGLGDNCIICDDCHALICKECCTLTPTPTPTPSEGNPENSNSSGENSNSSGENSGGEGSSSISNTGKDVNDNSAGDSAGGSENNKTSNCSSIDYLLFILLQFVSIFSDIPFDYLYVVV